LALDLPVLAVVFGLAAVFGFAVVLGFAAER
jgi:hypothetical protein